MTYNVTLIPGDGIGPEVIEATRRVLEATDLGFKWDIKNAGGEELERNGSLLPEATLESIRHNKIALKGPITTPIGTGFRSVNVALRQQLDLYCGLRPCKFYKGVNSHFDEVDLVLVRENMEDLYAGVEYRENEPATLRLIELVKKDFGDIIRNDMAVSLKLASVFGSRRIFKFAFEYARSHNRRKVTAVHKANIMKYTDGLFLAVAKEVAKEYPEIEFNDVIVDAMTMHLVMYPEDYDILVLPNLYGDILSDLGAALVGGLGMAPGGNIGDDYAVFEATHGSAPQIAGKNIANPLAMILSGVMLLRHLNEFEVAQRLENAISELIEEGREVTHDMKHDRHDSTSIGTQEVADAIIRKLRRG